MKAIHIPSCRFLSLVLIGAAISLALATSEVYGTSLFADSFAYPVGPLSGDGPPPGSPPGQTGWNIFINGNPQVTTPGLRFPGVLSAGNTTTITGATGSNGDIAEAGVGPVGGGSGTIWVGFLIREARGGPTPFGFAVVGLSPSGPGIGLIFNMNLYGIDNNTGLSGSFATTTTGPSRTTVWLVLKLDFTAGTESLFVNPTAGSQPDAQLPMTATFQASGFSGVTLAAGFNTASFNFDEVRIGTTFNDVKR